MVHVELVYVPSDQKICHFTMDLDEGANVLDALHQSGLYELHPETKECAVGIYAKLVTRDTLLKDGDRVELYRPLVTDPKEKRRRLARLKKK